jgi:hypothetical protein
MHHPYSLISHSLSSDCERFLIARKENIANAAVMVNEWWVWWNTPMNAYNGVTPANVFSLETFEDPHEEIAGELCPHALFGEDKYGNPIYW